MTIIKGGRLFKTPAWLIVQWSIPFCATEYRNGSVYFLVLFERHNDSVIFNDLTPYHTTRRVRCPYGALLTQECLRRIPCILSTCPLPKLKALTLIEMSSSQFFFL